MLRFLLSIESRESFLKYQDVQWLCGPQNNSPCKTWNLGAYRVQNEAKYEHLTDFGLNDFSYLEPTRRVSPSAPHKQIGCNLNWLRLLFFSECEICVFHPVFAQLNHQVHHPIHLVPHQKSSARKC